MKTARNDQKTRLQSEFEIENNENGLKTPFKVEKGPLNLQKTE